MDNMFFNFKGVVMTVIIACLFGYSCSYEVKAPERPDSVPENAVWIGGPDGGEWIYCEKKSRYVYSCKIYNDYTGGIECYGNFVFCKIEKGNNGIINYIPTEDENKIVDKGKFYSFDTFNISISFEDSEFVLVADGWIFFPFSDEKHGKKQKYRLGKEVSSEIQY